MLSRPYQPLFASLYGVYCSSEYEFPLLMIFLKGWAYWYVPETNYEKSDRDFIAQFESVKDCMKYYKEARDKMDALFNRTVSLIEGAAKSNSGTMKGRVVSANTISEIFDCYGKVLGYPRMTIGSFAKACLTDHIAQLLYGDDATRALTPAQRLTRDWMIPYLTYSEELYHSPGARFEVEVLETTAKLRNQLVSSFLHHAEGKIKKIVEGMPSPYYATSRGIKEKITNRLEEGFQTNLLKVGGSWKRTCENETRRIARKFAPVGCGWQLGGSLQDNVVQDRIVGIWQRCFRDGQLWFPEQQLAAVQKYQEVMKENQKKTERHLQDCAARRGFSYDESCGIYSAVIILDASIRLHRKYLAYQINHALGEIATEVSNLFGLKQRNILCNYTSSELVDLVRQGRSRVDVAARAGGCAIHFEDGQEKVKTVGYDETIDFVKEIDSRHAMDVLPPLGGMPEGPLNGDPVGFSESIAGRAFVLDNEQDLLNVGKDDILVARFIEPYHGLMFRAPKAIVVEDGNVASHAVRVAQTRAIPILVGARGAVEYCRRSVPVGEAEARPELEITITEEGKAVMKAIPQVSICAPMF